MATAKFVCLLRGINVSGHKMMKMEALRTCLQSLGLQNVRTYLQSGNAVFDAPSPLSSSLTEKIAGKIAQDFGFEVPTFLLPAKEWEQTLAGNPFLGESGLDPDKLHVTFLSDLPAQTALEKLATINATPDRHRAIGQRIYLHCPEGYGRTKLSNQALERILKTEATTRNWRTVKALMEMLLEK